MKISLEWLKDYIDVPESPVQLKEDLTMAGLVVESVSQSGENVMFEFEITSNRPDCLSHMGIAREIAALYKRPIKIPPGRRKLSIPAQKVSYSVEIRDA